MLQMDYKWKWITNETDISGLQQILTAYKKPIDVLLYAKTSFHSDKWYRSNVLSVNISLCLLSPSTRFGITILCPQMLR
jgi:hypothetical protein